MWFKVFAGIILPFVFARLFFRQTAATSTLNAIPSIGWSGPITSYLTAFRFIYDARTMLEDGYKKYHYGGFKIPLFDRWLVMLSDEKKIGEVRSATNEQLSVIAALQELMHFDFSLGPQFTSEPYHLAVISRFLGEQNLRVNFAEILDEIRSVASEQISTNTDWTKINSWDMCRTLVLRTHSRVFVGFPLCRNEEYMALNTRFATSVVIWSHVIRFFPKFLHKTIRQYLSPFPGYVKQMMKLLQPHPLFRDNPEVRNSEDMRLLDIPDENLLLSALAQVARGEQLTLSEMSMRLLAINFVSVWTSTVTMNFALYRLALSPDLLPVLREEVETSIRTHGWTQASINSMRLLDSFVKESQRLSGVVGFALSRKAMQDFTFSDGTHIPAGTIFAFPIQAIHHDENNYDDPLKFSPYRFVQTNENSEPGGNRDAMTSANTKYLEFGIGRNICPGRFLVAHTIKLFLANTLMNYDIHVEDGAMPRTQWLSEAVIVDRNARMMFRKRQF